mmetsp:Transcript_3842/g.8746  ORF Transcript_3842/g.8746 Transcript_3842/m.8746 type:complete len:249 (-) Transcript_3842:1943-2689(-)
MEATTKLRRRRRRCRNMEGRRHRCLCGCRCLWWEREPEREHRRSLGTTSDGNHGDQSHDGARQVRQRTAGGQPPHDLQRARSDPETKGLDRGFRRCHQRGQQGNRQQAHHDGTRKPGAKDKATDGQPGVAERARAEETKDQPADPLQGVFQVHGPHRQVDRAVPQGVPQVHVQDERGEPRPQDARRRTRRTQRLAPGSAFQVRRNDGNHPEPAKGTRRSHQNGRSDRREAVLLARTRREHRQRRHQRP